MLDTTIDIEKVSTEDHQINTILAPERNEINEKEAIRLATHLFQKDYKFMDDIFTEKVRLFSDADDQEVRFRALAWRNPEVQGGIPILITRPDIIFDPGREYANGNGAEMHHQDIWRDWKDEASRNPNSERAKVRRFIDWAGGKDSAAHLYLRLFLDEDQTKCLAISAGWSNLVDKDETSQTIVRRMKNYGINRINIQSWEEDIVDVEKLILEDILSGYINKSSEKLSAIVTPRSLKQYRELAHQYLMDPNPNKLSILYPIFLEYQELLSKLS